jgi:luciferase family oxidoreductase group 1
LGADDFPAQLEDLFSFLADQFPERHPFREVVAMPRVPGAPELWMLGSSDYGARLAAELGLPYAFAQHFSTLPAKAVIELYRRNFRPGRFLTEPRVLMAVHAVAAESDAAAAELALPSDLSFFLFRQTGKSRVLPTVEEALAYPLGDEGWRALREEPRPKFVGSPATLRDTLVPFVKECGVDELMVLTMTHDQAARKRSYEIVAELFR